MASRRMLPGTMGLLALVLLWAPPASAGIVTRLQLGADLFAFDTPCNPPATSCQDAVSGAVPAPAAFSWTQTIDWTYGAGDLVTAGQGAVEDFLLTNSSSSPLPFTLDLGIISPTPVAAGTYQVFLAVDGSVIVVGAGVSVLNNIVGFSSFDSFADPFTPSFTPMTFAGTPTEQPFDFSPPTITDSTPSDPAAIVVRLQGLLGAGHSLQMDDSVVVGFSLVEQQIPEPAALALVLTAGAAVLARARHRRRPH